MKHLQSCLLAFALVCLSASQTRAAWVPNLPGWTVHEVPVSMAIAGYYPNSITMDPLTGDLFVLGTYAPGDQSANLMRISQSGEVHLFATVETSAGPPTFDPVHRVVLLPQQGQIARFTESGAPLAPISTPHFLPITVAPNGDLYAVGVDFDSETWLQITRYDPALDEWVHARQIPRPAESWPPISYPTYSPTQLLIDDSWRMFVTVGFRTLFRIDEDVTRFLGTTFLGSGLAAGSDMILMGPEAFDPAAATLAYPQHFATATNGEHVNGVAATPGGNVIYLSARARADYSESYSLAIFTMGPTPAVQRSWGALKSLGR